MRFRRIGHNHLVTILSMFEEVVDAFLFHQTRRKVEIRFAILRTVFARIKAALYLVSDIESVKNPYQDFRHRQLLKDAALLLFLDTLSYETLRNYRC